LDNNARNARNACVYDSNNFFCAAPHFTLYGKKIEIDFRIKIESSYKTTPPTTEQTMNAAMYWTAIAHAVSRTPAPAPTTEKKLTSEERNAKSDEHKFGLCPSCDSGLDDRADFMVINLANKKEAFALLCTPCYYNQKLQSPLLQPFN
jgi:hypothetical protein